MDVVKEKLKLLPDNPGVYIMLDGYGNVIYVGKARVLKNRVRQYFHSSEKPEKVMKMVENVRDFNYIITDSEIDALALENNLINSFNITRARAQEILTECGIDLKARGETLTPEQFALLSEKIG